jgi:hypothetical protein
MEDTGGLPVPKNCPHVCEEPDDDWDDTIDDYEYEGWASDASDGA